MSTPFRDILSTASARIPGVIAGALAAGDGELVDAWSTWDEDQWAFLTAHLGIVVNHVRSAMHTFHFGDVHWMSVHYDGLDLIAEQLGDRYFVLIACEPPMDMAITVKALESISVALRKEMF